MRRQSTNDSDELSESYCNGEMGDTVGQSPVSCKYDGLTFWLIIILVPLISSDFLSFLDRFVF